MVFDIYLKYGCTKKTFIVDNSFIWLKHNYYNKKCMVQKIVNKILKHNHINKWSEIIFKLKKEIGRGHDHRQLLGMIQFTHSFIDERESSKKHNGQCRLGESGHVTVSPFIQRWPTTLPYCVCVSIYLYNICTSTQPYIWLLL